MVKVPDTILKDVAECDVLVFNRKGAREEVADGGVKGGCPGIGPKSNASTVTNGPFAEFGEDMPT